MPSDARPITLAIAALGGQGGGVLAGWVVDLAERAGYLAQYTSVPGVAQRTGATIYYLELFPAAQAVGGKEPVLALMPVPGDVDIVLASELMEAGRAVQRGFVTPDRTTLIASTHRVYAISEKSAMADGIADNSAVARIAREAARQSVLFDMAAAADATASMISAVMFGALAGSNALPIERAAFEETIRAGALAVEANLAGFTAGFERARAALEAGPQTMPVQEAEPRGAGGGPAAVAAALAQRIEAGFPAPCHDILRAGAARLTDYQDPDYASDYLDRVAEICALDTADHAFRLTKAVARHLALWMSYEDTIRVADLKTRASRFDSIRREVGAKEGQVVRIVDYVHPRIEEICDTLPPALARRILSSPGLKRILGRFLRTGRRVRTSSLSGFLLFSMLAGLKRWRRRTFRYDVERRRIADWLERIAATAPHDYDAAVEIAACQQLVKGYGDTHERGIRNYMTLMAVADQAGAGAPSGDLAPLLRRLREAALADEDGKALHAELDRLETQRDAAQ